MYYVLLSLSSPAEKLLFVCVLNSYRRLSLKIVTYFKWQFHSSEGKCTKFKFPYDGPELPPNETFSYANI